jgi:hypothetical protein
MRKTFYNTSNKILGKIFRLMPAKRSLNLYNNIRLTTNILVTLLMSGLIKNFQINVLIKISATTLYRFNFIFIPDFLYHLARKLVSSTIV